MATLTTQTINRGGSVITPVAANAGGDAMTTGSGMMLEVVNGGGSPQTVTLAVPSARTYEPNIAITSLAVVVGANATKLIGPVDGQTFMDPTTGLCTITYTGTSSVSVAAIQLTQP